MLIFQDYLFPSWTFTTLFFPSLPPTCLNAPQPPFWAHHPHSAPRSVLVSCSLSLPQALLSSSPTITSLSLKGSSIIFTWMTPENLFIRFCPTSPIANWTFQTGSPRDFLNSAFLKLNSLTSPRPQQSLPSSKLPYFCKSHILPRYHVSNTSIILDSFSHPTNPNSCQILPFLP